MQIVWRYISVTPDPVPTPDGEHYQPFEEVYGKETTGKHRPSLSIQSRKGHLIPFNPNAQYARNVAECIDCSECQRPRVIYALHKLSYAEVLKLQALIGDVLYSCGNTLQELDIEGSESSELLSKVFVRAN